MAISLIQTPIPSASLAIPRFGDGRTGRAQPPTPAGAGPGVVVNISAEARAAQAQSTGPNALEAPKSLEDLSVSEREQVRQLQDRDAHVRAHEAAHVTGANGIASAPSYTYETGPDGQRYVVGGEVRLDTTAGVSSEATVGKAQRIRAAALAPSDPSNADQALAQSALHMLMEAQGHALADRVEQTLPGDTSQNHPAVRAYRSEPGANVPIRSVDIPV